MFDVSIIIPTFNRLWSLPKAVASCRDSNVRVEIIVIDDGSSDGTWDWLQTQDDVVTLRQENWGKCWAVNKAFGQCQGEYVRFLDSDDWLLPGANARQVALARSNNADIVVAGCEVYDESEQLINRRQWQACDDFVAQQLGECYSSHYSACLFRESFLRAIPHRPDFAWRDDRLLLLEAALARPRVTVYPQPALGHRQHAKERLQFRTGMRAVATNLQHLTLYRKILATLESRNELTKRRKDAACKVLWPLAHWIAYSHPDEACEVADWVFKLDPEFRIPESGALGMLYRHLGFRTTEKLLRFRRTVRGAFIGKPRSQKLELS
jgi:glycosyltransferase involved in cell wall biosynthesis